MKSFIGLLLGMIVLNFVVPAKTTSVSLPNIYPHFGNALSTGATGNSRITGNVYAQFNGAGFEPFDSITYKYSFGRGGELNTDLEDNSVFFEESIIYIYDPANADYNNRIMRLQSYNSLGKPEVYTIKKWRPGTQDWKDSTRFIYTYNANFSRLDSTQQQIWQGVWADHVPYKNFFDANNNLTKMESIIYKMEFIYDANNNPVQRLDKKYSLQNGWQNFERYTFNYDVQNRIVNYVKEIWDAGAWKNELKIEYTFAGAVIATEKQFAWNNNNWEEDGKHVYLYDAGNNKLSDEWQTWDAVNGSYVNSYMVNWVYNSFNQPTTVTSSTWDVANSIYIYTTEDVQYRFYYETFDPTMIKDIARPGLKLFPNPAQNDLNLYYNNPGNESYQFSIFDAQGRGVRNWTSQKQGEHSEKIPVGELNPGNYFLCIRGTKWQSSMQFAIIR